MLAFISDYGADKSVEDLKLACEREPSNAAGHNNLGLSYFEMKLFEAAADCFKEVGRRRTDHCVSTITCG